MLQFGGSPVFVTALKFLLRLFSYLFHSALSLFVAGLGMVGRSSSTGTFNLGMIPWWSGTTLVEILTLGGLLGLVSTILAIRGRLRFLFALWTTVVVVVMVWGLFLSNYSFEGPAAFQEAILFTGAAILAWLGGVQQMFRKR